MNEKIEFKDDDTFQLTPNGIASYYLDLLVIEKEK